MSGFIISCGGSGGHLAPGISIAEKLIEKGHQCWIITSKKQVDTLIKRHYPNLDFIAAPGIGFSIKPQQLCKFIIEQIKAILFSLKLIRQKKPDTIIAFGGFATISIALADLLTKIPLVLHEANRKPGKAVRLFRSFAKRIYLPEGIKLLGVNPGVIMNLGLPLRKDIRRISKEKARTKLSLSLNSKVIVVLGGSQGASILNEWVHLNFNSLAAEGLNVYCITGLGKGEKGQVRTTSLENKTVTLTYCPFSANVGTVLSSADLVLSRAGASTIAELIRCQTPSILIPYPYAAENHQVANARYLEQKGGCIMIEQSNIDTLLNEVIDLVFNDELLGKIRYNLNRLNRYNTVDLIVDDLEKISSAYQLNRNDHLDVK